MKISLRDYSRKIKTIIKKLVKRKPKRLKSMIDISKKFIRNTTNNKRIKEDSRNKYH